MKFCGKCGGEALVPRRLTTYSHDVSGVVVELSESVLVIECGACSATAVVIPNHEGLVAAVAVARVHLPTRLLALELRFLRKALGLKAAELAAKLEVTAETISRWERGHMAVSSAKERHLRVLVALALKDLAPAIDSDLRAIIDMDFAAFRTPEDDRPMRFELIKYKERDTQPKRRQWDTAEPIAEAA